MERMLSVMHHYLFSTIFFFPLNSETFCQQCNLHIVTRKCVIMNNASEGGLFPLISKKHYQKSSSEILFCNCSEKTKFICKEAPVLCQKP